MRRECEAPPSVAGGFMSLILQKQSSKSQGFFKLASVQP